MKTNKNKRYVYIFILLILTVIAGDIYLTLSDHQHAKSFQIAPIVSADNTPFHDQFDLRQVTTKQFLALIASSSPEKKIVLYQAHYQLSSEVMKAIQEHIVGDDLISAAQSSQPYLINEYGWSPLPVAEMEIWSILEFRVYFLIHPDPHDPMCNPTCVPLTEEQIITKLGHDGQFTYSRQDIENVYAELDANGLVSGTVPTD